MFKLITIFSLSALMTFIAVHFIGRKSDREQCFEQALDWANYVAGNPDMTAQGNKEFFATKLAQVHLSCPKGHILVDERSLPDDVKHLAFNKEIIENAKAELNK